jgi:hypothetical protein
MKLKCLATVLPLTVLVAACGGGGGDAGKSLYEPVTTTTPTTVGTTEGSSSVASDTQATVVLSLSSTQISSSSPGTVTAVVKDAKGVPIRGALVAFTITGGASIASVSPMTVVTNEAGEASTIIKPASTSSAGGAFVNASVEIPGVAVAYTTKVAFSVSALNVTMASAAAASGSLAAYASTTISVTLTGVSASNPVRLLASSTCSQTGKATISPESLTVTQNTATLTYQDQGCGTNDQVNVSIEGTSQSRTVALGIAEPVSTAIQFSRATPTIIGLKGSGSPTQSLVTFKVTDQQGKASPGVAVDFSLDQPNIATLTASTGTTDTDGFVTVGVNAKTTPSPVRVRAALASNSAVFVPSSELTINAGRPTQNSFSMAFEKLSMNANLDGDASLTTVTMFDRYGNPVPDGTRVNLVSEGGGFVPASCVTSDAQCQVKFIVSNPRPADGRVAVTAYAVGEESYVDANRDLDYTSGETYGDLGMVFLDKDDDGVVGVDEYITGAVTNNVWDGNSYVRQQSQLVFSRTNAAPRFYVYDDSTNTCTNTLIGSQPIATVNLALTSTCQQRIAFCVRDSNSSADVKGGNPLASGSTLAVSTDATGASVTIDQTPIPDIVSAPTRHLLTVKRSSCAQALSSSGTVSLTVRMGGNSFTYPDFITVTP